MTIYTHPWLFCLLAALCSSSVSYGNTETSKQSCQTTLRSVKVEVTPSMLYGLCQDNSSISLFIEIKDIVRSEVLMQPCRNNGNNIGEVLLDQVLVSPSVTLLLSKSGSVLDSANIKIIVSEHLSQYKISAWGSHKTRFILEITRECKRPSNFGTGTTFSSAPKTSQDNIFREYFSKEPLELQPNLSTSHKEKEQFFENDVSESTSNKTLNFYSNNNSFSPNYGKMNSPRHKNKIFPNQRTTNKLMFNRLDIPNQHSLSKQLSSNNQSLTQIIKTNPSIDLIYEFSTINQSGRDKISTKKATKIFRSEYNMSQNNSNLQISPSIITVNKSQHLVKKMDQLQIHRQLKNLRSLVKHYGDNAIRLLKPIASSNYFSNKSTNLSYLASDRTFVKNTVKNRKRSIDADETVHKKDNLDNSNNDLYTKTLNVVKDSQMSFASPTSDSYSGALSYSKLPNPTLTIEDYSLPTTTGNTSPDVKHITNNSDQQKLHSFSEVFARETTKGNTILEPSKYMAEEVNTLKPLTTLYLHQSIEESFIKSSTNKQDMSPTFPTSSSTQSNIMSSISIVHWYDDYLTTYSQIHENVEQTRSSSFDSVHSTNKYLNVELSTLSQNTVSSIQDNLIPSRTKEITSHSLTNDNIDLSLSRHIFSSQFYYSASTLDDARETDLSSQSFTESTASLPIEQLYDTIIAPTQNMSILISEISSTAEQTLIPIITTFITTHQTFIKFDELSSSSSLLQESFITISENPSMLQQTLSTTETPPNQHTMSIVLSDTFLTTQTQFVLRISETLLTEQVITTSAVPQTAHDNFITTIDNYQSAPQPLTATNIIPTAVYEITTKTQETPPIKLETSATIETPITIHHLVKTSNDIFSTSRQIFATFDETPPMTKEMSTALNETPASTKQMITTSEIPQITQHTIISASESFTTQQALTSVNENTKTSQQVSIVVTKTSQTAQVFSSIFETSQAEQASTSIPETSQIAQDIFSSTTETPTTSLPSTTTKTTSIISSSSIIITTPFPKENQTGSDDEAIWPAVAALVIGIPSIIVLIIAIAVVRRKRRLDPDKMFTMRTLNSSSHSSISTPRHNSLQQLTHAI